MRDTVYIILTQPPSAIAFKQWDEKLRYGIIPAGETLIIEFDDKITQHEITPHMGYTIAFDRTFKADGRIIFEIIDSRGEKGVS